MRLTSAISTSIVIAATIATLAASSSVETRRGTIMCGTPREWTQSCPVKNPHFVFVTGTAAYEIKSQNFSGFKDLIGEPVSVTGEISGKKIAILELMKLPKEAVARPSGN